MSGRSEEAIGIYDDIEARFGHPLEPALMEFVARARANRIALRPLGD